MYFYIKGTVVEQYGSYIVLDKDNIGYLIKRINNRIYGKYRI